MQQTRYYSLFRFYTTVGVTDRERQTIAALGEACTIRVIGHDDPEAIDPKQVWDYLKESGIMPDLEGKTIQGGAMDGTAHSTMRSWETIDTQQPEHRHWTPRPEQVIQNPVVNVTATEIG
jgi:hypothetical protein